MNRRQFLQRSAAVAALCAEGTARGHSNEELEEVRRGLGLENFVLYGHSWGGMLAIEYALSYP
jgi:pimeloyl-ACP methyl ester carboxylesterase